MKPLFSVSIIGVLLMLCACTTTTNSSGDGLEYPYYASKERASQIHSGIKKLVIGMPVNDVKNIMGAPDEIRNVFFTPVKMKEGKPDGFSYFYIIQRKKPFGGIVEKNEKLYRVRFNANGILIAIEKEGIH